MKFTANMILLLVAYIGITLVAFNYMTDINFKYLFAGVSGTFCLCTIVVVSIMDDMERKLNKFLGGK